MISKRIIGVLTVKDGRVVKSYGYAAHRPACDLVTALKNLDRWAADEIVVLDISRRGGLDDTVLRQIAAAKIATPLAYGGGIRRAEDISKLMDLGCDRFVLESVLYDDPAELACIAALAGRQALIGSVPVQRVGAEWSLWRPFPPSEGLATFANAAELQRYLLEQPVSEYFITAVASEGHAGRFPAELPEIFTALPAHSVIWFGGLDRALAGACLRHATTAAFAVGNPLHEAELVLPAWREALLAKSAPLRAVRILSS